MDKKIVMLVEDSATIRQLVKEVLETACGYEVLEFPNGALAIIKLGEKKPHIDAAVLDIVMMGHGGSVRDYLKKIPQYKEIPIIYHTSLAKVQFDNRILESAHYVQKSAGSIRQIAEILKNTLSTDSS